MECKDEPDFDTMTKQGVVMAGNKMKVHTFHAGNSFFEKNWRVRILFVWPLIPLISISNDICTRFRNQGVAHLHHFLIV